MSSYPHNSAEEKSGLFSEAKGYKDAAEIWIAHAAATEYAQWEQPQGRRQNKFYMSHYPISPFGKRYKITFRVITFLFVEGYGILVY